MAEGVRDAFGASAVAAYLRDPALGLRVVHSSGYPALLLRHSALRLAWVVTVQPACFGK